MSQGLVCGEKAVVSLAGGVYWVSVEDNCLYVAFAKMALTAMQ